MGARFTVGKLANPTTGRGGLSTEVFPYLGGLDVGSSSILYFLLDTSSGLFYDPASRPKSEGGDTVKKKKAKKKK